MINKEIGNVLILGGNGHLGTELRKYLPDLCDRVISPEAGEYDITNISTVYPDIDLIINSAAYVDVARAEIEKEKCYRINTLGTYNLLCAYEDVPFVQISTEYVLNPVNFYSRTKLEADRFVTEMSTEYLILRSLFKPNPFPHKEAFHDQYTTGDYIDVIAPMMITEILIWINTNSRKTVHINTGRKTMLELAKRTNPGVGSTSVSCITDVILPKDYIK